MGLMMKTDIAEATKKVSLSLFVMVVTLYDVHCIKVAVYVCNRLSCIYANKFS